MLYKDNPNLKLKTIITHNGNVEYRNNCKYIKEQYYLKNTECVEVEKKLYLLNDEKIAFDHSTQKYVIRKNTNLVQGIVEVEPEVKIGWFSKQNIYYGLIRKQVYYQREHYNCSDYRMLENNPLFFKSSHGRFYETSSLTPEDKKELLKITNNDDFNHLRQGYNIEDNGYEYLMRKLAHQEFPIEYDKGVRKFAKFLENYSFGCEFETNKGYIPTYKLNQTGLVPCRDGSVEGAEYVTIPLRGAKGLQTIKNVCKELTNSTSVNINCSYHVHIGNLRTDRAYLISLYRLFFMIQDELFTMFPYYKTKPEGIKQKNYCQKLKRLSIYCLKDKSEKGYKNYINTVYEKLFTLLSEGNTPCKEINKKQGVHPVQNKWDRKNSRYFALNLANMLFSNRRTAEFRISPPTTNYIKATNLLFIYVAIVKYADVNLNKILISDTKISLKEVLNIYKTENFKNKYAELLSDYLNAYVDSQKKVFKEDFERGDFVSAHDLIDDKTFSFTYGNINCLF